MRNKSTLLGGAAVGVLLALSAGAEAKTKHHHAHAAEPAPDARIGALADEIESLKARLDAETLARQQDEAKLQEAQTQAAQATADAQSARTQLSEQIQTIPGEVKGEVKTEVAAATPKPGWWGNTTVGGTIFADVSNIHQTTTSPASAFLPTSNGNGVDLKRFYIAVDHKFDDTFSANLTTDVTYDATTKASQLYVKKAFLQAKLNDAFSVRLGSADLPWVPFVESLYGYRYVENVLIDRTKFGTSADWGVHAFGAVPAGPLKISYAVSAVNGAGYKIEGAGTVNRSQDMDLEGRLAAQLGGFTAAVGGYEGKLGKDVTGTTVYHTAQRIDGIVAYVDPHFRLGAEYLFANYYNNVTTVFGKPTDKSEGYSFFGSYNLTSQYSIFGRYDHLKPLETTDSAEHEGYYNVGVAYAPTKGLDFALVYKHDNVANDGVGTGLLTTANGSGTGVGSGSIGGLHGGDYDEFGLFTSVKW